MRDAVESFITTGAAVLGAAVVVFGAVFGIAAVFAYGNMALWNIGAVDAFGASPITFAESVALSGLVIINALVASVMGVLVRTIMRN